nr:hypothetical protein [Tanacetum cinerariifolium]
IDNLDIDDLYNNLEVYEADIKGSSGSSSNSQNVDFVSAKSTSSTNKLNAAYSVSTTTGHSSQAQEDLEKIDQNYLEEIDLKWQVAMFFMRVNRFYNKIGRKLEFNGKELVGFDKNKVECFNCHRRWHFARDCRSARNSRNRSKDAGNAGYKGRDNEEEATDFALMAFTSNPSSSPSLNSELDEALKEKEDIKAKLEKFETSLKNITKLLDSQISAKVKTGLGYDSQFNEKEVLDIKEEEVTEIVFDNHSSDEKNSVANDRLKKGEGYHAVPPPLTGNYMPPKPDLSFAGLDDSIYKFKISETVTSLAKDEKDTPETSTACVEKPKEDWSSAPLIEDWETDSDDDNVFTLEPIPSKIDFVKAGKFTPLFESMLVQNQAPEGEDIEADEHVHQEGGDSVERAITIDVSLVAVIDQAPRNHIGGTDAQTRFKITSKRSSDPPLSTEELNLTNGADTEVIVEDKGSGEKGGSTARVEVSATTPSPRPITTTIFGDEDLTIAQTLIKMKSKKVKEKGVSFIDVEEPPKPTRSTTTLQPLPNIDPKNKGKGVLVEEEPEKLQKVKRRNQGLAQIKSDADLAQRIYEEELAEMDVDHELVIRMTHREQEMYTIKDRARLLAEYFQRRKKQLAAERAEAIRSKPPTRTQVRNMMITYLEHIGK